MARLAEAYVDACLSGRHTMSDASHRFDNAKRRRSSNHNRQTRPVRDRGGRHEGPAPGHAGLAEGPARRRVPLRPIQDCARPGRRGVPGLAVTGVLHTGDALTVLRTLPAASVQCCVTSPPYWGLRDYGVEGQLGLEKTPDAYVERLVGIFAEVRRVLRTDGTCWVNLGDSYARDARKGQHKPGDSGKQAGVYDRGGGRARATMDFTTSGFKPKDLIGIPWMVAFSLRKEGWYLRSDIVWAKPNVMPESVTDRPTKAHEYVFLLSKSERYFYDADAIREPHASSYSRDAIAKAGQIGGARPVGNNFSKESRRKDGATTPRTRAERAALLNPLGRNARSVWTIHTKPYRGAHFAVFPEELPRRCISAGSRPGDVVLDPFAGSGTTCAVAKSLGRNFLGIELNETYTALAEKRIAESA
jgi:DNA modification methylase